MARILIVEDELLIVEDLKSKLRRLGHIVVGYATSGAVAIRTAVETKPEIVLMDVRLRGEMNGIEAAERIGKLHAVAVVYVTAHAAAVAQHVDREQRQFVLTKPFSATDLERVLEQVCGSRSEGLSGS